MHVYVDYQGKRIHLTEERLAHILEHPEMEGMESRIPEKHRCVVVSDNDAFILTAYLVSRPAGGRQLWPKDD